MVVVAMVAWLTPSSRLRELTVLAAAAVLVADSGESLALHR
jgi:hypothetical protein